MTMLDTALWEPTPLGVVGPRGLLDAYYAGHHNYVYHGFPSSYLDEYDLYTECDRLYRIDPHNSPATLSRDAVGWLEVVRGKQAILAVPPVHDVEPKLAGLPAPADERWLATVARRPGHRRASAFAVASPYLRDDRIAFLHYGWTDRTPGSGLTEGEYRAMEAAMWVLLVRTLARDGYVGCIAFIYDEKLRDEVVDDSSYGLFVSLRSLLKQKGLLA
jgi:hypothetical protein